MKVKPVEYCDAAVNTDLTCQDIQAMEEELLEVKENLEKSVSALKQSKEKHFFQFSSVKDDDNKIKFYTGFSS